MSQYSAVRPEVHHQPNRVERPEDLVIGQTYRRYFYALLLEDRGPCDSVGTCQSEVVTMRDWDAEKPMLEDSSGRIESYHLSDLGLAPYEGSGWSLFHYLVPLA